MLEDSDRLLATIEQILRTGRMGAASRPLNLSRDRPRELVEECVDRARAVHDLPTESLRYARGPPITVRGDADEVRAAIANLIDNAMKYSGKEAHVTVEMRAGRRSASPVRVKDEGPGIPKSELKQIFKRFYRVPGARWPRP